MRETPRMSFLINCVSALVFTVFAASAFLEPAAPGVVRYARAAFGAACVIGVAWFARNAVGYYRQMRK